MVRRTPTTILADQDAFDRALANLCAADPLIGTLLAGARPRLRRHEPGFAGLAAIVIAQQVSTSAAAAIHGRLAALLGEVSAQSFRAAPDEALRACGLSANKRATLRAVADAIASGDLDLLALAQADPDVARSRLTALRGVGPWTADIYLLFGLGHADVFPAGDLALQEAARLALGLGARPSPRELIEVAARWRPLRGVAAHCLWFYYGTARPAARAAEPARTRGMRHGRQT